MPQCRAIDCRPTATNLHQQGRHLAAGSIGTEGVSTRNQGSKPAPAWEVEVGGNLVETARAVGVSRSTHAVSSPIKRHILPPSDIPFSVGLSSHGPVRQIGSVNSNRGMRLETNPVTGRAVIVLSLCKSVPGRPASENGARAGGVQRDPLETPNHNSRSSGVLVTTSPARLTLEDRRLGPVTTSMMTQKHAWPVGL